MPLSVLLPISLDRVSSPISTLLRKIAEGSPAIDFYSFSSPVTAEDRRCAERLWSLPHVHSIGYPELLKRRFDVVHHASATPKNLLAARIAKLRSLGKVRHVFTANCEPYATDRYLESYKRSVARADHLVAVSKAVKEGVIEWFGRTAEAVIPNGFDEEFYFPVGADADPPEGVPREPFVLWAAQILDRKHPEVFLEIARRLPSVKFLMVGNNPYPDTELSKQTLATLSTLPNVDYLGIVPREHLRNLLQHAGILLFPSDYEGLPLTVVEALGCGCPVIAQNKSSLPEVIRDGENGWLIDNSEIGEWVGKVSEVLAWDGGKREEWRREARQSVLEAFSWSVIARQQGEFYHSLMNDDR